METIDFYNKIVFEIPFLNGKKIFITETVVNTWIIVIVLLLISILVKLVVNKFDNKPNKLQNFIELIVDGVNNITIGLLGKNYKYMGSFFGSLFLFILFCNLIILVGLRPPTSDISTTLALATIVFFLIQGYGIKSNGIKEYIKNFFRPFPIMVPLNIISQFTVPISMAFRLFGNILAGTIIVSLIYSIPFLFAKIGIPIVLHAYFDLFAGILQAFIFTLLSIIFVKNSLKLKEEV